MADVRVALNSVALGVAVAFAIVALVAGVGAFLRRESAPPWVCDDTRYVDTVPAGFGVIGPSLSAPPGCGR